MPTATGAHARQRVFTRAPAAGERCRLRSAGSTWGGQHSERARRRHSARRTRHPGFPCSWPSAGGCRTVRASARRFAFAHQVQLARELRHVVLAEHVAAAQVDALAAHPRATLVTPERARLAWEYLRDDLA